MIDVPSIKAHSLHVTDPADIAIDVDTVPERDVILRLHASPYDDLLQRTAELTPDQADDLAFNLMRVARFVRARNEDRCAMRAKKLEVAR